MTEVSNTSSENLQPSAPIVPAAFRYLSYPGVALGWVAAFAVLLLVIVVFATVLLKVTDFSSTSLEDLRVRLYAWIVAPGMAYALVHHSHVRMDLIRRTFPNRVRLAIEFLGTVCLLIPMVLALTWWGWEIMSRSFSRGKVDMMGQGLPYLWTSKLALPIAAGVTLWVALVQSVELVWRFWHGVSMPADEDAID